MKIKSPSHLQFLFLATTALFLSAPSTARAQPAYPIPTYRPAVDQAVTPESLQAAAAQTSDPDTLLGLAYLAPVGSLARQPIANLAIKAKPDYAPLAAELTVAMDGPNDASIANLIKTDPTNALGYYLQAHLLYRAGKEKESLAAFRQAAACPELRLYEPRTAPALFKALDALHLQGPDRLAALAWIECRTQDFYSIDLQPLGEDLGEIIGRDIEARKELSDLYMVLGGQLYVTNFQNRWFAYGNLVSAFRIKAEIAAAEKSPTANSYVAAAQALVSVRTVVLPAGKNTEISTDIQQFLPERISEAFSMILPAGPKSPKLADFDANVPDADKHAFEKAKQDAITAATALINISVTDPDGIIGSYLKGLRPAPKNQTFPWTSKQTYVEKLLHDRPDVFQAAVNYDESLNTLRKIAENDPIRLNGSKLLSLGLAIYYYRNDHNDALPQQLNVLYEKSKYLKDAGALQSLVTGRPYIYLAAGKKLPDKSYEIDNFILLYDDNEQNGCYPCLMGDCHVEYIPVAKLKEQIAAQNK